MPPKSALVLGGPSQLEAAPVFAELMGQLHHPQSVGAGADEPRCQAHQRPYWNDSVGQLETLREGHLLLM